MSTKINRYKIVPYSNSEMYELVNNVRAYPEFLPWCQSTEIIQHDTHTLMANVNMSIGKLKKSFTTENYMSPGESINMRLVKGPFKKLAGQWQFIKKSEESCEVALDMEFEFKNLLIKHAMGKAFNHILDTMVDAFSKRAVEVYGER